MFRQRGGRLPLALMLLLAVSEASAQRNATVDFSIQAEPLSESLKILADQSNLQLVFFSETTEGLSAASLQGEYTPEEALGQLLANTQLEFYYVDRHTVAIRKKGVVPVSSHQLSEAGHRDSALLLKTPILAQTQTQNQERQAQTQNQDSQQAAEDVEEEREKPLEEIIVTGTHIRGIAPESSPVRTFTREDIQISGAGTAEDFIRTLTANFGGGASEFVVFLPNDSAAARNISGGSSVNLRGLGSGSTLVLLNGHRLAPSSSVGDVTDISMIPASAIKRVELLTDGASSIYGSDAIAGVTNFILRDDFEGVETSFRYGIGTQHRSAEEFRGNATGGLNWDSGHALVSYEYFNQNDIGVQDRSYSQDALPPGDLQPSQKRHSVLATISQDLTSDLDVFADVAFSRKESRGESRVGLVGTLVVRKPTSKTLNVAAGGTWKVSDSWYLDFSGTYGEAYTLTATTRPTRFSSVEYNSDIWTSDIKLSGTVLRMPGGELKLAFGGHFRTENYSFDDVVDDERGDEASRDVYAAFGEAFIPIVGPDNSVPGIERLELNVSGRFDDYSDFGSTANPKVGVLWSPVEGLRLRGSYSTSFNPPPIGLSGPTSVSAVNTAFWFPLFGITPADPSLADTVWLSTSGVDKNLGPETSRAFTAGMDFDHAWNGHKFALSTTWFDIDFEDRIGKTPIPEQGILFEIPNIAFNNPAAFPEGSVIFAPTMDQISAVLEGADTVNANMPPFFGDPFDATIIDVVVVTRNLSRSIASGLDFAASYTYIDAGFGALNLGIDATHLLEFKQQATSATPVVSLVSTLLNPVDLKLRGHAGYSNNGFTANLFVNYVNDYQVSNVIGALPIGSWTTVDLSLSYDTQGHVVGPLLDDTVFRLFAINLFDQDPPSTPTNASFGVARYDPTNASPLGRFIGFEVTKRF